MDLIAQVLDPLRDPQDSTATASEQLAQIDQIAVGVGPGSFTGIRAGIATALGLSLASCGQPVYGVSIFQMVAYAARRWLVGLGESRAARSSQTTRIAVVVPGRYQEVSVQLFGVDLGMLTEPVSGQPRTILDQLVAEPCLVTGPGVGLLPIDESNDPCRVVMADGLSDDVSLAELAALWIADGLEPLAARPLYPRCDYRMITDRRPIDSHSDSSS